MAQRRPLSAKITEIITYYNKEGWVKQNQERRQGMQEFTQQQQYQQQRAHQANLQLQETQRNIVKQCHKKDQEYINQLKDRKIQTQQKQRHTMETIQQQHMDQVSLKNEQLKEQQKNIAQQKNIQRNQQIQTNKQYISTNQSFRYQQNEELTYPYNQKKRFQIVQKRQQLENQLYQMLPKQNKYANFRRQIEKMQVVNQSTLSESKRENTELYVSKISK